MPTSVQVQHFSEFKNGLRDQLGADVYNSYFDALTIREWKSDQVTLGAKNHFSANLITERYRKPLGDVWVEICGPVVSLRVEGANEPILASFEGIKSNLASAAHRAKALRPAPLAPQMMTRPGSPAVGSKERIPSQLAEPKSAVAMATACDDEAPESSSSVLNPDMTLDRYCVNDTNRLARQAVTRLLEGTSSPITYVYGTSGRGKSHLLNAAAVEWMRRRPGSKLRYISYDSLMSDVVDAHISSNVKELRRFLHDTDILVFDDVHMLRGRKRTQEELACLLERMQQAGKPVLVAGALSPTELAATGISQRLADRLSGGVKVEIETPDLELRQRVVEQMAAAFEMRTGHTIPQRFLDLIARRCDRSVRDVQGAVHTFELEVESRQADNLTDDRARRLLETHLATRREKVSLDDIFDFSAEVFGITPQEMKSKSRKQHVVRSRQAFCIVARKITDAPLTAIGGMIDRDHTTVMHSISKAEIVAESDAGFGDRLTTILEEFGAS
ncbi:MAG: DnaA/Hda family protein [Pseudomonadota bacterium]